MSASKTVIIGCAGKGSRLGLGVTKALINIDGKSLIIRHLEQLAECDDVRIVVGYQAQQVIDTVLAFRRDVTFVFNHEYGTTGTGGSVNRAAKYAGEFVLTLDGDLIVHPDDLKVVLKSEEEFLGVCKLSTDDPVYVRTKIEGGKLMAHSFSRESGDYEWTGLVQIRTAHLGKGEGHVYQLIEHALPLATMQIRSCEIDTPSDYENARVWVREEFK